MNIFDKLKFTGIEIGRVQSVDEMTLVPILGASRGDVADPQALKFQRTSTYGTMVFENTDPSKPSIVPTNLMVRGAYSAQDHAMASSGVITRGSKSFQTACCIEQSQGGFLGAQNNEQDILPIELRRALLNPSLRQAHSYSKLWEKIGTWLRGLPTTSRGSAHLRYFYDTPSIKEALENFAAEFEPVNNQIGAIIMFSGVPVGVEIMPTSSHWEAYWKMLIRGCYGAEMLRLKMLGKLKPSALIMPEIPPDANPTQVNTILEEFTNHLREEVLPILESIQVKSQQQVSKDGMMATTLINTTSGGGGDMIVQGGEPIYLSLVL